MSGSGPGGGRAAVVQDVVRDEEFVPTHISTKAVRALEIVSADDLALGYVDVRLPDESVRQVEVPMGLGSRGTPVPGDRLILYADGYVSWCPAHVFVRDYRAVDTMPILGTAMDFGQALRALKRGERVCRAGWNGKAMWLVLIHPGNAAHRSAAGIFDMQPCIGMKTAQGQMQPGWLASQTDMLAEDWMVVPDVAAGPEPPRVPRLPEPAAYAPSEA